MPKQIAIANTIFQLDWNANKATIMQGDPDLIEFCSNEDCVIHLEEKDTLGCTVIELWKDQPRTFEVVNKNKPSRWYAEPRSRFTGTLLRNSRDPQDPPVIG